MVKSKKVRIIRKVRIFRKVRQCPEDIGPIEIREGKVYRAPAPHNILTKRRCDADLILLGEARHGQICAGTRVKWNLRREEHCALTTMTALITRCAYCNILGCGQGASCHSLGSSTRHSARITGNADEHTGHGETAYRLSADTGVCCHWPLHSPPLPSTCFVHTDIAYAIRSVGRVGQVHLPDMKYSLPEASDVDRKCCAP